MKAYTPAWAEQITGVSRSQIIRIAREFADNADKTHGRSMIIVGAGLNHWYHLDMNYRGLINMLIFCGCVGQSGGGWAHYVGQEKLRPQTGWQPLAFALDWQRPARHMNSTSFSITTPASGVMKPSRRKSCCHRWRTNPAIPDT
ncbi:molybdopterin-dependent oxidoreductase [Escherichia coli]|uniref:molybdopterin-dependent oxidoreductase n=1 Tax=Escherichia coli TaxID=562 RepID=UPI0010B5A446|nr:molybdopterin-dependent oxidoreductase [Escherichia coli]VFT03674.1 respiratory nitrate reductase 1 subunit alpha [Escherichia coli]